ncbi:MAG: T9SS type A sorting domain-containing protein [Bacteroidales bacterium]|nr:T9SS type A sorting domain-containing protein [Bacteroidales bacterium]
MNAKQFLLTAALILCSGCLYAQEQFDNSGFEQWNNKESLPVGWYTLSYQLPVFGNIYFCDIKRSTDAAEGQYCAEISPERLDKNIASTISTLTGMTGLDEFYIPALLTNAKVNLSQKSLSLLPDLMTALNGNTDNIYELSNTLLSFLSDGKKISSEKGAIKSVSGYYKFNSVNAEEGFVIAALLVNNSGGQRSVAGGGMMAAQESTDDFVYFNIPVVYADVADEIIFIAVTSVFDSAATQVGSLKIDDISINYQNTGIDDVTNNTDFAVYPNPAANKTFKINVAYPQTVRIYNMSGVLIKEIPYCTKDTPVYLNEKGVYLIKTDCLSEKITVK